MKFKVCDLSEDELKAQMAKNYKPVWYLFGGFTLFLFVLQLYNAKGVFSSRMLVTPSFITLFLFTMYKLTIRSAIKRLVETEFEKVNDSLIITHKGKTQTLSISKFRTLRIQVSPLVTMPDKEPDTSPDTSPDVKTDKKLKPEFFVNVSAIANRVFINSNSTKLIRVLPLSELESFLEELDVSIPNEYFSQYGLKTSKEKFYKEFGRKG